MIDFEVQAFTRRCAKTDQPLQPGDTFFSALIADGAHVKRQDYAEAAWDGPPAKTIGWWKSRVADKNDNKMHWAPNDVILHYFEQLADDSTQADTRYVLGLLMIRRRIVRLEEVQDAQEGQENLLLYCPRNEREYELPVVTPTDQRVDEIQQTLAKLLFADSE